MKVAAARLFAYPWQASRSATQYDSALFLDNQLLLLTITEILAAPRHEGPRPTAGNSVMARVRTIVPRCKAGAPVIDAFQCSECEWSYEMRWPEPYAISYEDAMRACCEFDDHCCEDFNPRIEVA
jgi:hypothetical protein